MYKRCLEGSTIFLPSFSFSKRMGVLKHWFANRFDNGVELETSHCIFRPYRYVWPIYHLCCWPGPDSS